MATLTVTNTYIAGTSAKASEVNTNFTDIVNWSAGNIQNDNIGTLSGPLTWSITTGVLAMSVANSGSEGSISITQSVSMDPNKAVLKISDTANQTSFVADLFVEGTNSSRSKPLVKVKTDDSSTGEHLLCVNESDQRVFSVKADGDLLGNSVTGRLNLGEPLRFNNGPILENDSGALKLDSNLKFNSGAQFADSDATTIRVLNRLELESGGPIISRASSNVNFPSGGIQLATGAILLNSSGLVRTDTGYKLGAAGGELRVGTGGGSQIRLESSGQGVEIDNGGPVLSRSGSNGLTVDSKQVITSDASSEFKIIRGQVNNGVATEGEGFGASGGSGDYTVTFTSAFSGVPTVTVSALNGTAAGVTDLVTAKVKSITASAATVAMEKVVRTNPSVGNIQTVAEAGNFTFIAIGPR